ncbi:MAG: Lipopolysaccharide assembly protein B [Planctomycetes bacterium]|nr:Lipopolysaccharide assembly protein B [Planctomycetota bacterium]
MTAPRRAPFPLPSVGPILCAAALTACASTGGEDEARAIGSMQAAIAAAEAGRFDEAEEAAARAAEERPGFVDPWFLRGALAEKRGDGESARAAYRRVLEIDPTRTAAGVALAQTYIAEGRSAEARDWLLRALDADPGAEPACFNLGSLADESGELDAAAGWMALSAALDARDPRAPLRLASIRLRQGRRADALAAAEEALRRVPGWPPAEQAVSQLRSR